MEDRQEFDLKEAQTEHPISLSHEGRGVTPDKKWKAGAAMTGRIKFSKLRVD